LTLLHDILSSRRHKTWSPAYEQVMILYLDLCLEKNKSREAKDGLHQYRNLSQSQAPGSLEIVIRYLIEKAEKKCRKAKETAESMAVVAEQQGDVLDGDVVDDLTAQRSILLSTMSQDPEKTQRETSVVLPSLKFLWETYRAVLDILRSNSKLEHLYHSAALGALKFAKVYKRKTEFRRLCDMLRQHLGNLQKYGSGGTEAADGGKMNNKVRGWEGWTTESIELHLQTRFAQLSTSSHLHLYTEGFRTVEDIYNILQISHAQSSRRSRHVGSVLTPPKAKLMATYYERLTSLFWVSENHLFHAFAWYKYYTLCREFNRTMSVETRQLLASTVLISALCIPESTETTFSTAKYKKKARLDTDSNIIINEEETLSKEKMARMATLLGFHTKYPTRAALLAELKQKRVLDDVPDYLKHLYQLLEKKSDALVLVKLARPHLARLKSVTNPSANSADPVEKLHPLAKFVKPLTDILLQQLLLNLSQAYYTVSLPFLQKLTTSDDDSQDALDLTFQQVERTIVHLTSRTSHKDHSLSVKIDHRTQSLRFTDTAHWEDSAVRHQLTSLSRSLAEVKLVLEDADVIPKSPRGCLPERTSFFREVDAILPAEQLSVLERKNTIEKRKEEVERVAQVKLHISLQIKAREEAQRKVEEAARLARETRNREKERSMRIQNELDLQEKKKYLKAMGKDVDGMKNEELQQVDTAKLAKEHADKIGKKEEERKRKMNEKAKKLDYTVRAVRIEELPIIKANFKTKVENDQKRYDTEIVEKGKNAKTQWEEDCKHKKFLVDCKLFDYSQSFEDISLERRKILHEQACDAIYEAAEKEARLQKKLRAQQRKVEREKEMAEEEARFKAEQEELKAEEERLKREQEKRKKEEDREKERQAEVARMQEERERKQREKEEQIRAPSFSGGSLGMENTSRGMESNSRYLPPMRRKESSSGHDRPGSRFSDMRGNDSMSRGSGYGGGRYDRDRDSVGDPRMSSRGGGDDRHGGGDSRGPPGRFSRDGDNADGRSDYGRDRNNDRRSDRPPPEPRNSRWN